MTRIIGKPITATDGQAIGREGKPGETPLLLSVDGVAKLLSCSPRTVREMVSRGEFMPPTKLGPRLSRWPRWQVEQFVRDLAKREA